jgi:hypothetical protein
MPIDVKPLHGAKLDFLPWLPCIFVLGWWLYEMALIWASVPRYRFALAVGCALYLSALPVERR